MLTCRIIPCLDVHAGRVVKGVNFLNLRDAGDPVEVARRYDEQGADELVFLDISASHEGRAIMADVVRQVAEQCFMPFTVGGGIRAIDDVTRLIQAGAEKVSINTAAVNTPGIVTETAHRFGRCATVVNIDPKRVPRAAYLEHAARIADPSLKPDPAALPETVFEVHTHGGRTPTGLEALTWARRVVDLPLQRIFDPPNQAIARRRGGAGAHRAGRGLTGRSIGPTVRARPQAGFAARPDRDAYHDAERTP